MAKTTRYPPELRERAIRLVREHRVEHPSEWAAIQSVAGKLGMTAETLRKGVRRARGWGAGGGGAAKAAGGAACVLAGGGPAPGRPKGVRFPPEQRGRGGGEP